MRKLISIVLILVICLYPVTASNMYNYVYNGTSWVPALSTADGQQKYWINMANASYGEVKYNLTVGQDIKVTGNLNVTGISYLGNTKINAENVSFTSGGELFANSSSVYYNNGSLVTDLRINNLPENAVMSFNQAECPLGWTLADGTSGTPDLRGIFIRGAGTSGIMQMANGTNFSATYGEYMNDSFQEHKHEVPLQELSGGSPGIGITDEFGNTGENIGGIYSGQSGTFSGTTYGNKYTSNVSGRDTITTGEGETRPASYALIYCVKTAEDSATSNSIWNVLANGIVSLVNSSQTLQVGNLNVTGNLTVLGTHKGVLQIVDAMTNTLTSTGNLMPSDDTIPQITEGASYKTQNFTPKSADSILVFDVTLNWGRQQDGNLMVAAMFVQGTSDALAAISQYEVNAGPMNSNSFSFTIPATNTSTRTYELRFGSSSAGTGNVVINGVGGGSRTLGGSAKSGFTITEILN